MELLSINMRIAGEHGQAIREVEGSSPGRTYILLSEEVFLSVDSITGKFV